jgi:hypothetical protein
VLPFLSLFFSISFFLFRPNERTASWHDIERRQKSHQQPWQTLEEENEADKAALSNNNSSSVGVIIFGAWLRFNYHHHVRRRGWIP